MELRFCPGCGAHLVVGPVAGRDRPRCIGCGYVAFRNPAPVGVAVVAREGKVVLVRRREAPLAGHWAPPGGYVELGESVPEAVVREVREECGLDVALEGLAGVFSHPEVAVVLVAYVARAIGGAPQAGDDASAVGLFAPGEVPVEPPPSGGTATDLWLHGVIRELLAPWERGPSR